MWRTVSGATESPSTAQLLHAGVRQGKAGVFVSSSEDQEPASVSDAEQDASREHPNSRFRLLGPITGDYLRPRSAVCPRYGPPDS